MKKRAALELAVLRMLIAAIDNAGTVRQPPKSRPPLHEVQRRRLSDNDVQAVLLQEYETRRAAAEEFIRHRGPIFMLKRLLLSFLVVVLTGCLALYALHGERSISTDISIHASPHAVWQVLTATEKYGSWNPMIDRIVGDLKQGNVIEVDQGMVFRPTLLAVRPNQELRWKGYVWIHGLFDGDHRFQLEEQGEYTRLIQSERFTGIFAGRLTGSIISDTAEAMAAMNRALKARVEAPAQTP